MISIIVPCIDATYLAKKLSNCSACLAGIAPQVLVCFNGPALARDAVAAAVSEAKRSGLDVLLLETPPGSKNAALLAGLQAARHGCILSTDVDCYFTMPLPAERWLHLARLVTSGHTIAFPVLAHRPTDGRTPRLWLLKARLLTVLLAGLGLRHHRIRGGGWMGGNYQDLIALDVLSDDLLYPLELLYRSGGTEVLAADTVIYEDPASLGDYPSKIPRLMYGCWQSMRRTRSLRNRLSIIIQKVSFYAAVAALPLAILALATTAIAYPSGSLPAACAAASLIAIMAWRWRAYLGCLRGWAMIATGRRPSW